MAIPGEQAIQMVRSAHRQAAQFDIAVTAVVVDESGRMIALGRMDKARPITVEIALNKAYTAASFQQAVVDVLVAKTLAAARQCAVSRVVVTGGVAANSQLRREMRAACAEAGLQLVIPQPQLCTDNGAMIAAAAHRRMHLGHSQLEGEALLDLDATTDDRLAGL